MFHVPTFLSDETNILQSTHRRFSTKINLIQNNLPQQAKKTAATGSMARTSGLLNERASYAGLFKKPPAA